MKKLLALIMCCSACLTLTACKDNEAVDINNLKPSTSSITTSSDVSSYDTTTSENNSSQIDLSSAVDTSNVSSKNSSSSKNTSSKKPSGSNKPTSSSKPSSSSKPVATSSNTESETSSDTSSTNISSAPVSSESEITLEQYIKENYAEINETMGSVNNESLSVEVFARGNSLVIKCKIDIPSEATSDEINELKSALESTLSSSEFRSEMKKALTELQNDVPSADSIIVEYYTKSGTKLASKSFS